MPWALSADRLGSRHRLLVNGQWVHGDEGQAIAARRGVPVATRVHLAPSLLRAGANVVEVELVFDYRAGMSTLEVGPEAELWPAHRRRQILDVTLPQVVNVFGAGLALFMLSIWWRRHGERSVGLFAGLLLLISLRNVGYTGAGTPTHTPVSDTVFYLAQVASAWLLAHFALAWSGRDWPRFARALDVGAGAFAAAALVATFFDAIQPLRVLTYPPLLASVLPSLWLMLDGARRERGRTRYALLAGVALLCLAPVHDYLHLRGLTSVMDIYWMPFTAPVTMLIFAWTMLDRFVAALAAVEGQAAELERRVERRTAQLAAANAAKTRFLAAASHDLRQPVVSISLLGGLLREQPLPAAALPLVQRIGDSVDALNQLLAGLLDLSRFDAGAVTPRRESLPLRPLLEAAFGDERAAAQRKGLDLRLRCADQRVLTDRVLLEQIVRNLVGNAVRYTDRCGVLVAARRGRPGTLRLQVWDTGRGIPPERQRDVFDEFVQLDPDAGARSRGLGLGLSLVRHAAELMGVPLRLRSRPGRGSCFEVELPLADAVAAAGGSRRGDASRHALDGRTAWVIDDEPEVRAALQLRLEGWGAAVRAFAGIAPCDAASAAASAPPDLVVTDQRLPDGRGVDLAHRLRERFGAALPVLLVTGDTAPHELQQLAASGLTVLHKPFDGPMLLRAVQALLAARAPR